MAIDTVVEKALGEEPTASYHLNSGLQHRVSAATKWRNGQESVKTALKGIQDALYSLPDYREAEEANDRDGQVGIINQLIAQTPSLTDYFFSHGLRDLMRNFIDKTGHSGLKKEQSPKALLDFYSAQKSLGWFDRTQQTYVQGWRIQENGMWIRGEQSVQLALEAIQDVLRALPGFRQAEDSGNRDEQVRIINQFITQTALADFFAKAGLSGVMQRFVDPEGSVGIRKRQSPKAVLEFYSENKGLGWFNRALPTHVEAWRIKEQRMWKNGNESAQLAIEAIEDVLYTLPGYRDAEQANRREEQLRILNKLLQQRGRQRDYFEESGLRGLMTTLIDQTGRIGPKKSGSLSALLEFYSKRKRLEWFSPAYAIHLAANRNGRLVVADRRPKLSDAAKKFSEGISLEKAVSALSDEFRVSGRHRKLGLSFLTSRLEWLVGHRVYDTVTESVIRDELQQFYYERGIIPINTAEGQKRVKRVKDFRLFRAFQLGILSKEKRHDAAFFRHYKRISERTRRGKCPSRADMIDQQGQMEELRSYYGRPVSYDDVLPVGEVMRRYLTGQRSVTIQIGSQSMQMTPETPDDFWIMNPRFIKLRINGKLVNERLYYFWRRVESDGRSNGRDSGKDGSEPPWHALFNHEGQQKGAVAYLGTAATWEAVASNPKAKFIKNGPLPSSELVRLGVLTSMSRQKGKGKAAEEAAGRGKRGTDDKPKYAPAHVSLEEFRGYVPASQLADTLFEKMLRSEIRQKGAPNIARAVQLAEEAGLVAKRGRSVEDRIRGIVGRSEEYIVLAMPGSDPKNPNEYIGLKKFLGEKGEHVKKFFYGPLERAVQNVHPGYNLRAVHQAAGGTITVLEESGIETKGDLEELLQKGWGAIQAVKGLVKIEPGKRERLTSFVLASLELGYQVPAEVIAATPLRYREGNSKPIKDAFRGYFEQAVRNEHPDWNAGAVRRAAGITISTFESNNILFMSQLEELAQRVEQEGESALQAVKGLVNRNPQKRAQLSYTLGAFKLAGLYPKQQPAGQAVAAAPSERAATA